MAGENGGGGERLLRLLCLLLRGMAAADLTLRMLLFREGRPGKPPRVGLR